MTREQLTAAFLAIARAEVGTREIGTSNRGAKIDEYLKAANCEPGQPWCAGFVAWCVRQLGAKAGAKLDWAYSAYCPDLAAWGKAHGVAEKGRAAPGMIMVQWHADMGRYAHTGIVESVKGSKVVCIEGNTNSSGGRSGVAVMRQTRDLGRRYLYIDWLAVNAKAEPAWSVVFPDGQRLDGIEQEGHVYVPARAWARIVGAELDFAVTGGKPHVWLADKMVPGAVWTRDGVSWCQVRDLAEVSGVTVKAEGRVVTVTRAAA